jgi:hypothetical protein
VKRTVLILTAFFILVFKRTLEIFYPAECQISNFIICPIDLKNYILGHIELKNFGKAEVAYFLGFCVNIGALFI